MTSQRPPSGRRETEGRPVLILAPTFTVAEQAAHDYVLGRPGRGWRYVTTVRDIQGLVPGGRYLHVTSDDPVARNRADLIEDALLRFRQLGWHNIS